MKYENHLNLFWAIVWVVVFILAVVCLFWKPAVWALVLIAGFFAGMFIVDFIKVYRM